MNGSIRGTGMFLAMLFIAVGIAATAYSSGYVSVEGERFLDGEGRHLILHGVNVVEKSKSRGYLGPETEADFASMRTWGFNCIRLGVIWDGIEPSPGMYNDEYLKGIDQRIAWARANGLYVFLDMHQDLFSVKYSDGAPAWATLDEGKPHVSDSAVWSDAYFTSPAVQTAFDNFWNNAAGPDGVGIQDHYARAWAHIAERYANEPTVIGFDLMNEPFVGSQAVESQLLLIVKAAELISAKTGKAVTPDELVAKWGTTEGRREILANLNDVETYRASVEASQALFQAFDQAKLQPFFQRVANEIRRVDKRHIIFLETTMASNMGVLSAIEPLKSSDGTRDPLQAYAPHGYDLVTDTPDITMPNNARVEFIFQRHGETAKRLGMPMLVGEWGAYGGSPAAAPSAAFVIAQFEKLLCSDTYWCFSKDMARLSVLSALNRPCPIAVAGTLKAYQTDPKTRKFTCVWDEKAGMDAPTLIYLPESFAATQERIKLSPQGNGYTVEAAGKNSKNKYVTVPGAGQSTERRFVVE